MNYKKFDPLKLIIKKEGLNYSLYKDELPLKISKENFVFEGWNPPLPFLQKDLLISHTSEELLLHMISELDGAGGVDIDGKGKIIGPNFFGSLALFSLQKGLIELEKEILLDEFGKSILFDNVLVSINGPNALNESIQSDRYKPLQKWLGQTLEDLVDESEIVLEECFRIGSVDDWDDYPELKELLNKFQKADCVVSLWDKYKSLSWEERTAVYYLFESFEQTSVLFPMALVSGHCSVEKFAVGLLASQELLERMHDSTITEEQQKELYEELRSDARLSLDYIKYFRKGTPNKYIKDLVSNGENTKLEFKSTLRKNLNTDKKDVEITHACMKTLAAFMNSDGGELLIGVSDKGDFLGIDADLKNHDKFTRSLNNSIKDSLGLEAFEYLDIKFYEVDRRDICVIKCKKADNLIFCQKKGGVENAYIRTGPETIILPPSKLEAYIKNKFLKVKK